MDTNMDTNNINKDSYFKKFWFPLMSGTIISIPIYILFKPDTPWIFAVIYLITCLSPHTPRVLDSYTKIKIAKIDARRQVKRDEIHQNSKKSGFIKYFWLIILSVIIVFAGSIILFSSSYFSKKEVKNSIKGKTVLVNKIEDGRQRFYKLIDDLDGDGNDEVINFHFYFGDEILELITDMEFQGQIIKMQGGAPAGYTEDINGDGIKEVIVELSVGANGIWTEIYKLDSDGKLEIIPTVPEYGSPGFFNKSGIKFVDYDDDGKLEVRVDYNYMPDPCVGQADVYEYVKGIFIKSEELKVFESTCRESMKKVTG